MRNTFGRQAIPMIVGLRRSQSNGGAAQGTLSRCGDWVRKWVACLQSPATTPGFGQQEDAQSQFDETPKVYLD